MKNSTTNQINTIDVNKIDGNYDNEIIEQSIKTSEDIEKILRQQMDVNEDIEPQIQQMMRSEEEFNYLSEVVYEMTEEYESLKQKNNVLTQRMDSLKENFKRKLEEYKNQIKELIESRDQFNRELDIEIEVIQTLSQIIGWISSSNSEPLKKKIKNN